MAKKKKFGHANLQPYPMDLNEPSSILLAKLNGEDVDNACCVHAGYQIQGVTLSHLYPDSDDPAPMGGEMVECPSDEEAKKLLEECTKKRGPLTDMVLKQLLAFVMAKLNEWLNPRTA